MLPLSHRIAFAVFALLMLVLSARGFWRMYVRVQRGRKDTEARTNRPWERGWYAVRTTLTQERVFRARPLLSVFHAFIFYCFVLYVLVNAVDALQGYIDIHLTLPRFVEVMYGAIADVFSILAIIAVLAFVIRRFGGGSRRDFSFNPSTLLHPAVRSGYIQRDSLVVSAFILFHIGSRIIGNAAKLAVEGRRTYEPFSSFLSPLFANHAPMAWRIFGYWGALGSIFLFLVYFPYSKHIHLLMAPLKYFFRREAKSGELPPLEIDLEAAEPELGAAKLADLAWPRQLDAYACIQCNRCQDVCPASRTGKALSPAALEINKRMLLNSGPFSGERSLLQAVISPESVWACTTCGACMEICPTQNEQMLDIIDIRRNAVMLRGEFPAPLQTAFRGMERSGNPWGISQEKRMAWADSLNVPTIDQVPGPDVLYWVGCAASYDASAQKTARAVVQLLQEGGVNFAVLGKRESCTGDSARRAGNEVLFQQMASTAIQTLNEVRPRLVIGSCPHCVNTISTEFPQLGGNFTVMHHTEYLQSMLHDGKLAPSPSDAAITFHDPCYLGRHRGTYAQPREVLKVLSNNFVELDRTKENAFCCGAGGAQFWKEEEPGSGRISEDRFHEVQQTLGPTVSQKVLAVGCPFCKSMLQSTPAAGNDETIVIKDVAELLLEGVQRAKGTTRTTGPIQRAADAASEPPAEPTSQITGEATEIADRIESAPPIANHIAEETSVNEADQVPVTEANDQSVYALPPAAPKIERKKWAPKAKATAPEAPAQLDMPASPALSPQAAENSESSNGDAGTPIAPARKKWQPAKKT